MVENLQLLLVICFKQALFRDEMIDNDNEVIALNSNDDDIFHLILTDEIIKITFLSCENTMKRLFRGTPTFSLDIIFIMSRPTVEQLCLLLGNLPQVPSEFNHIIGRPHSVTAN